MKRDEAETDAPQNDTVLPQVQASLFPVHLQPSSSGNDGVPEWLQNTSFTTDISVINDVVASRYKPQQQSELESEDEEEEVKEVPPRYELLDSSASDGCSGSSVSGERKSRKKRKKKKRRKRELSSDAPPFYDYTSSRKPDVRSWTSSSATNKDYYFDSRGDRDNLAFGSLYRSHLIVVSISVTF